MSTPVDRPHLVIPRSTQIAHMLDAASLASPRARGTGIVVLMPRQTPASDLIAACYFWPKILRSASVGRVAVILHRAGYERAEPLLPSCRWRMEELGVTIRYFHDGDIEANHVRAWFEAHRRRLAGNMVTRVNDEAINRHIDDQPGHAA